MSTKNMGGSLVLLAACLSNPAWAQLTSITITSPTEAWVQVNGRIEGRVNPFQPVRLTVAPGEHRLEVVATGTGERFEQVVEAKPGQDVTIDARPGGPQQRFVPGPFAPGPEPLDSLERQKRDAQIRQLDLELDNLNRQKAEQEILRSKAESHLQRECQGVHNEPDWMKLIRQAGCLAAQQNLHRANGNIARLQVEIDSKQRQLRRLEPTAQFPGMRF